ncbi:MAG: hypothetical protein JJU22_00635 [Gammaproteobacteria bacterium]|nr:hypothetical protein [Gammaproteobacteria bacterium]
MISARRLTLGLAFALSLLLTTPDASSDGTQNWGAGSAVDRLESELGRNPFDPVTLNNLAVMRAERGNYHAAADLLARARRLAPENETIRANQESVESWLAGRGRSQEPDARGRGETVRALPPEPPPLWH